MSIPETQKAVFITENSESVDVIQYADTDVPQLGPTDILVKNKYAGVNFIDAYFRKGIYPAQFPHIFGREASGVVAAAGKDVTKYEVGDKVTFLTTQTFARYSKLPESHVQLKKLPKDTTDKQLELYAASLLQGLTALTLAHEAHPIAKGEHILVWAAAGGVGQYLVKYATSLGAHVIAVASSDEKLAVAKKLGAEYLIKSLDNVAERVKEITGGKGVAAVYDAIGKDTWDTTFESVGLLGTIVTYGNASGVVPPLNLLKLSPKNLKVTRPQLFGFISTPERWLKYTDLLKESLDSGLFDVEIFKTYPLSEYKQATTELEGRRTTGKLVLEIPQ